MSIQCPHCGMRMGGLVTITDKPSSAAKCPFCGGSMPTGNVVRIASREEGEQLKLRIATAFLSKASGKRRRGAFLWVYVLLPFITAGALAGIAYVFGWW